MRRILLLCFLFGFVSIWAAEPSQSKPKPDDAKPSADDTTDQPSLSETITVSAEARAITVKESTAKVSVITSAEIDRKMANNIRDLIRYEPGVTVDNDPTRLGLSGFNIRGVGGNRVATVVDGVRSPEQFEFGPLGVHRFFLDIDMIDQVEIVRSASSSLYGSDALGGLVSFQTKDPEDLILPGRSHAYQLSTGYDDRDGGSRFGMATAHRQGRFQWLARGIFRQYNETENMDTVDTNNLTRTTPNPQDGEQSQFLLKGVYDAGSNRFFRATIEALKNEVDTHVLSSQGEVFQFGARVDTREFNANDESSRLRTTLSYEDAELNFALADRLMLDFHYQDSTTEQDTVEHRITSRGPAVTNIRREGAMDFEQQVLSLNLRLDRTVTTDHAEFYFIYGASFERDNFEQIRDREDFDFETGAGGQYHGTLVFPTRYFPPSDVERTGAFVQMEALFFDGRLKLIPGLRYDRNKLDPDQNDPVFMESVGTTAESMTVDRVTPKVGVQYEVNRFSALSFQYAGGFRAPPYSAVNTGFSNPAGGYTTLANPDLDAETSDNLEVGLKLYNKRGSLFVTWFDNQYEDFIENIFIGVNNMGLAMFQSQNLTNVDISGLEVAGDLTLGKGFRLQASFADMEGENKEANLPLNRIPPQRLVLGLDWTHQRYQMSLSATRVAEKSLSDVNDETLFRPDDYTTLDLTAGMLIGNDFQVRVGGFNLTDETYHPWPDVLGRSQDDPAVDRFTAPGRTLTANLSYRF